MEGALFATRPTWYVPVGQKEEYEIAGARFVKEVEGTLPMKSIQLNSALEDGFARNEIVVTVDDDYVWSKRLVTVDGKKKSVAISLQKAISELVQNLQDNPQFKAAGISASTNAIWADEKIKFRGNMNGQITAHAPSPVRYDPNVKSKVDVEYCFAHHAEYGGVVINPALLLNFHMFGRPNDSDKKFIGGFQGIRTPETQANAITIIKNRYGIDLGEQSPGEQRKTRIKYADIKWVGEPSWTIK